MLVNLRAIVSSIPLLRRAWRFLPGPLRIPVLVIGAGIWLWQRFRGGGAATAERGQGAGSNASGR
jgi:hypothetical protein